MWQQQQQTMTRSRAVLDVATTSQICKVEKAAFADMFYEGLEKVEFINE